MQNQDLREQAAAAGVKLWRIADEMGINDGNFSRKLRHELPPEEKKKIAEIIERLREVEA